MNISKTSEEYEYNQGFKYGIITCLSIAAAVGFMGNILLVIIITKARKLKSVMNRFVLHLAIGDLIVCCLCIPLFLAINFYDTKGNTVMCKLSRFLQYLAPQGTIMLLITIGLNRHQAIVHPLQGMTYKTANRLIFGAWLYSIIVVAPSIYLTNVQPYVNMDKNVTMSYCATIPVSTKIGLIYVLSLAFFGYVIPLFALLVLYSKISYAVWKRNAGTNIRTSRPAASMLKTRKKVIKMFLTVILVFVITWLPLIIYVGALESYFGGPKRISYTRLTLYAVGLSNSIYNPFIYSFFNKRFREGCKSIFRSSARLVAKRSGGKRSALREKNKKKCSYIGQQDLYNTNSTNTHENQEIKFDKSIARRLANENGYDSTEGVKLLNVKLSTSGENKQRPEPLPQIETGSSHDQPQSDSLTPSGSVANLTTPKKKKAYRTLSVDRLLLRSRSEGVDPKNIRKARSLKNDPATYADDFENIF